MGYLKSGLLGVCSLLSITLCAATVFAGSGTVRSPEAKTIRTWDEFVDLINSHSVKSIDDLLSVLPTDFLQGHTFVYRSKALHRELVSERRPRVIVYGTDGKFILTYNSHVSGQKAKPGDIETVETIAFGEHGAVLREMTFNGITPPISQSVAENPQKCTQCHGTDPKGLWDPYNHWAGVYGSLSRGGIDFVRISTPGRPVPEYEALRSFLEERKTNPRYSILDFKVDTLSHLNQLMTQSGTPLQRPFFANRMEDALVFKDGHTFCTNQLLGILIDRENLGRLGRTLQALPKNQRDAFQYFVKGISRDEPSHEQDTPNQYECGKTIDQFFPPELMGRGFLSFWDFQAKIVEQQKLDYNGSKAVVEENNMGLSRQGAGFSTTDPFDEDIKSRDLVYDSVLPPLLYQDEYGQTEGTEVLYLFYLLNQPYNQLTPATDGSCFNFYYTHLTACHPDVGAPAYSESPAEDIEAFVTRFVPKTFYSDPGIDRLSCSELASRSRLAISRYISAQEGYFRIGSGS